MLSSWKKYISERPTDYDLRIWRNYSDENTFGVCLICGSISGNLEVIDIDNHLKNAAEIFSELISIGEVSEIIAKYDIPIERTKSGGYHLFFRCESIAGNQKLAVENKTAIIETRGEGGLIVCAPSKGYTLQAGNLCEIPIITESDREILLNYCKSFDKSTLVNPEFKPDPVQTGQQIGERPGDIYNRQNIEDAKSILIAHGWKHLSGKHWRRPGKDEGVSATFGHIAPDVFYPFTPNASPFEPCKVYHPFDILTILEFNGDYKAAAKHVADLLGLKPEPQQKKTYGTARPVIQEARTVNGTKSDSTPQTDNEQHWQLWTVGKKNAFKIDYYQVKLFLEFHGFFRYEINKDKFIYIRVENNICSEKNFVQIRDFILDYILRIDRIDMFNEFMDSSKFAQSNLSTMAVICPDFIRDTKDECFIFFRNYIAKITAKSITKVNYGELPGMIWKSQILERDYSELDKLIYLDCDASKFAAIVSNKQLDRIKAYKASLGYLLHGFKKASFAPVIVFNDENATDEPTGGTGKGLSVAFVSQMRNVVTIDGKSFDTKNQFSLQRVSQDTQIIFLDDIARNFPFESLFSMITTGIPIRKLYLGEIFLPFAIAPKFAITTNYAIRSKGDSFARRLFEIEIFKYFTPSLTPCDEFGRDPFNEWDSDEYSKFDNFMIDCVQEYLKHGLIKPEYVTLRYNKLKIETHKDFVQFAEDLLKEKRQYNKREMLMKFREVTDDRYYSNHLGSRKFLEWCEAWATYNNWDFTSKCGSGGEWFGFGVFDTVEPEPLPELQEFKNVDEIPFYYNR